MTISRTVTVGQSLTVPLQFSCPASAQAQNPNWGLSGADVGIAAISGSNLVINPPSAGQYTFSLDLYSCGALSDSRDFIITANASTGAQFMDAAMAQSVLDSMTRKGEVVGVQPTTQCGRQLRNAFDNGSGQVRAASDAGIQLMSSQYAWSPEFAAQYSADVNWFLAHALAGHPAGSLVGVEARRMFVQVLDDTDNWQWLYRDVMPEGKMVRNGDDNQVVVAQGQIGASAYGERRTVDGYSTLFMRPFSENPGASNCNDISTEVWPYPGLTANAHIGDTDFFGAINRSLMAGHRARVGGVQVRLSGPAAQIAAARIGAQMGEDLYVRPAVGDGRRYRNPDNGVTSNVPSQGHPYNVLDANFSGWIAAGGSLTDQWLWLYWTGVDGAWGHEADARDPMVLPGEPGYGTTKLVGNKAPQALTVAQFMANPPLNPDYY